MTSAPGTLTRADICSRYIESVPYALYPFQEEALLAWFESTGGLMVCAPTGMGKTLIAESAVFEALHSGTHMYYTTPLIALTEQKYREFQSLAERWGFSRDDVGLITGNRRENPDARVRVVVAEILLNHLLAHDPAVADFSQVSSVVMDEFHSFNDPERGIVWELSLVLLPATVRVLLLSATVGNPFEFCQWMKKEHQRDITLVTTAERRVPLETQWVEDRLLTELLPEMVSSDDAKNRTPALVFCFNRDECWEVAERLKGLAIIASAQQQQIEEYLSTRRDDLADGVGPKLRQMLLRGVGVHHAGVLPKHKAIVEELFNRKLAPFVICTETLAAGINLPARSVVLTTLLKGPRRERKLVAPATAHQIFGRAGRPQFDAKGYVFAVAHEDDVRIFKWKKRYDQIDPHSKDPGIMRARKELERKRPTRRKTETYWMEGHFKQLIEAGPAKLYSRNMIPYQVLVYLLIKTGGLSDLHRFLNKRFTTPERIERFKSQLTLMLGNLAALGYIALGDDGESVTIHDSLQKLTTFRSVDPLFAAFVCEQLKYASLDEKLMTLDALLELPPMIERKLPIPDDMPHGPLRTNVLDPLMVQMGVVAAESDKAHEDEEFEDDWDDDAEAHPPSVPEMLRIWFESKLTTPEPQFVQPKWITGSAVHFNCEFFKLVRSADLVKQEGLVLRHLLRMVILSGEFLTFTDNPEFQEIADLATRTCRNVDPSYTDRFLSEALAAQKTRAAT
ncbi:MAG: DEAD/DEAH box helicase [Phycisphaerales bacterium]|nr:DEAD/DEAH box helicase [Phycisphaerales bacterium]